jgi:hypothetical protein
MNNRIIALLLTLTLAFNQVPVNGCTNFLAGAGATVDGSTIIPIRPIPQTVRELYHWPLRIGQKAVGLTSEWDTGKPLGRIPQVAHTYSVVGNMNEYQVTIGETTFGGRPELVDTTGIIDYGSLIYITLQRAATPERPSAS